MIPRGLQVLRVGAAVRRVRKYIQSSPERSPELLMDWDKSEAAKRLRPLVREKKKRIYALTIIKRMVYWPILQKRGLDIILVCSGAPVVCNVGETFVPRNIGAAPMIHRVDWAFPKA